jgi:hypothetical protein
MWAQVPAKADGICSIRIMLTCSRLACSWGLRLVQAVGTLLLWHATLMQDSGLMPRSRSVTLLLVLLLTAHKGTWSTGELPGLRERLLCLAELRCAELACLVLSFLPAARQEPPRLHSAVAGLTAHCRLWPAACCHARTPQQRPQSHAPAAFSTRRKKRTCQLSGHH